MGSRVISCSIVSEIIQSTMLFKRKSVLPWPITLTTLDLCLMMSKKDSGLKKSPHFSQCATGCAMPQLGGEETLCLQFFILIVAPQLVAPASHHMEMSEVKGGGQIFLRKCVRDK